MAAAFLIGPALLRQRETRSHHHKEMLFKLILESMTDKVIILDRDLVLIYCNKALIEWARGLEFDFTDYKGRLLQELCPIINQKVVNVCRRIYTEHGPVFSEDLTRAGDRKVYTESFFNPVFEGGEVIGVVAVLRDNSDRREIKLGLRRSEERLRTLMDQAGDAIVIDTGAEQIVDVNETACRMFGYSRAELLQMHTRDLENPDMAAQPENPIYAEFEDIQAVKFDTTICAKDGRLISVEIHTSALRSGETPLFLSIVRDITKRKEDEREKERLIKELQEALNKIKVLSGLVPICSSCHKIRDDKGFWNRLKQYISEHSDATFTHGICPECREKLYPELKDAFTKGSS